jgi:hypothetical protein
MAVSIEGRAINQVKLIGLRAIAPTQRLWSPMSPLGPTAPAGPCGSWKTGMVVYVVKFNKIKCKSKFSEFGKENPQNNDFHSSKILV